MKIVTRVIKGKTYRFLVYGLENGLEVTFGYLDHFNKVHLYTA